MAYLSYFLFYLLHHILLFGWDSGGFIDHVAAKYNNSFIIVSCIKLVFASVISLALNSWWTYGLNDDTIIESCSNTVSTGCVSYCNDVAIVGVNITDDDFYINPNIFPSEAVTTEHYTIVPYCIAELRGYCAYDYWLVFKLVPLLLHVLQFLFQMICWWSFRDFTPQEKQFNTIIEYYYPGVCLGDGETSNGVDNRNDSTDRWSVFKKLMDPPFYSVFAFIETFTVVYVWGELFYPSYYCDSVRPLSLYYYPVLMSLTDLMKLNMFICTKYIAKQRYTEGVLALLNIEILWTNTWITFALAVMFVVNMVSGCMSSIKTGICDYTHHVTTYDVNVSNPMLKASNNDEAKVDSGGMQLTEMK